MDDDYLQLIRAVSQSLGRTDPTAVTEMLISETVKFRDRLKEKTGRILTVADTRAALDALEVYIRDSRMPDGLTWTQKELTGAFVDRLSASGS
ncbi:MAG: hypothetical protein JSU65_07945 [Candidatus Zixiibacteriota bacterium]|nr:MAG: hypothetical protein JSU65_07945 [candidate division Zixibacteria bacterium]